MRVLSGAAARQAAARAAPAKRSRHQRLARAARPRAALRGNAGGVGFARDGLTHRPRDGGQRGRPQHRAADSEGNPLRRGTGFRRRQRHGSPASSARSSGKVSSSSPPGIRRNSSPTISCKSATLVRHRLDEQRSAPPDLRALASAVTSDDGIAEAVAQAVARVGADGVVDVKERSSVPRSIVDFGVGFAMDAALPSEHLGAIAPATVLELDDVFVLVANENVSEFGRLGPILEGFAARKKSLAIVARDVSGAALEALVRNRREIGLQVVALKPTDVSSRAGQRARRPRHSHRRDAGRHRTRLEPRQPAARRCSAGRGAFASRKGARSLSSRPAIVRRSRSADGRSAPKRRRRAISPTIASMHSGEGRGSPAIGPRSALAATAFSRPRSSSPRPGPPSTRCRLPSDQASSPAAAARWCARPRGCAPAMGRVPAARGSASRAAWRRSPPTSPGMPVSIRPRRSPRSAGRRRRRSASTPAQARICDARCRGDRRPAFDLVGDPHGGGLGGGHDAAHRGDGLPIIRSLQARLDDI